MIIYLAGPLFSLAERRFNEEFAKALERSYFPSMVILPQDHAAKINEAAGFSERMYCFALDAINHSEAIVAILDGADTDSGTCIEMGYAKAKGKLVIGVRTDFRSGEDRGLNLMVSNICSHLIILHSTSTTLEELAEEVARVLADSKSAISADADSMVVA
ncbi:MAG: nucleoside 2-deoxyribosyltransferase [Planctomycetota bacterium]